MKTTSILIITVFITFRGYCQINIDSLKSGLEKTHIQVRSTNNWNAYTIKYLDKDSLVKHIIPFDKNGKIDKSIWDIALSSYYYDSLGREIERRYYDIEGNLYFSDWPPIVKFEYNENGYVSRKTYYGEDEKILDGFAIIELKYDQDGDVVEDKMLDGKQNLLNTKTFDFNEEKNVVIETRYGENNEFISRRKVEYQTGERELLVSITHLNEKNELIEMKDDSGYHYSIMKYADRKSDSVKIELFDMNNEKVHEFWQYVPKKR